ncbi:MAG: class I SAM-dependent methyltransferase [Pyrinomonadaceae bacterium]
MAVSERFKGANVIDAGRLSPYWGEHAARYEFALPFVESKKVLDLACGTGYGIGLLGKTARSVIGIDVDVDTALAARGECGPDDSVLLADGVNLPFANGTMDIVTSFETLEHLHSRAEFLAELRRVLKKDGMLILSTPNANYTEPKNGKPANPFHIYEYTPGELLDELSSVFSVERFLGQGLRPDFGIPPFEAAQQKLSSSIGSQGRLFGWKVMNKLGSSMRDSLSSAMWDRPFYPTPSDYLFEENLVETAPVLVAVCRPK